MTIEVRVPPMGESVSEATIGNWHKKPGEAVKADDVLVELETDKVTVEVRAQGAGVLASIAAKPGDTVNVGGLLGAIEEGGAAAASAAKPAPAPAAKPEAAPLSPAVRKIVEEQKIDPAQVAGTGRDGRILKVDVMDTPAAPPPAVITLPPAVSVPVSARSASPAADGAREERVRMSRLRQTIARRLKDAQNTAAMLTTFNEVDMSAAMATIPTRSRSARAM